MVEQKEFKYVGSDGTKHTVTVNMTYYDEFIEDAKREGATEITDTETGEVIKI